MHETDMLNIVAGEFLLTRPFGMPRQVFLVHFEPVVSQKALKMGKVKNGSTAHFPKTDSLPSGILKCVCFQPVLSLW